MIKALKVFIFALVLGLPVFALAQTSEKITSFHSDIEVFKDASIQVTETIKVISTGDQIRRGIYRDFPLAYKDSLGQRYLVEFELLAVTKDGIPETYRTERAGNGIRIYVGKEDVFLVPGKYTYALTYKVSKVLGFFQDHDELYWNVTGNGWVFEIENASATVKLPSGILKDKVITTLYTGAQGSTVQGGFSQVNNNGAVEFKTTKSLFAYEGLTVVVGWPKGFVTEPTQAENFWHSVKANLDYVIGILGFLLVLFYYFYTWNKVGRDPQKGTVIPQYDPPKGFSPALLRFVKHMGMDDRTFAAAIINLGVKGKLSVHEEKGFFGTKKYSLTKKTGNDIGLITAEEQVLLDGFFKDGDTYKLEKSNAVKTVAIRKDFLTSLTTQTGKQYFAKNLGALALGTFFSTLAIAGAVISSVFVSYGFGAAVQTVLIVILIAALVLINIIFGWLLRAYTLEGRKLVDEIEGFKLFLSVTEKDRLAFHNPPEQTPELFEKFLPFALALGVEHKWAEQFSSVFAKLKTQGVNYAPLWFYGSMTHFNASTFASDIGNSFTGVVSSASTPPGSSSGFSGGSGGGGGGGGGGGW